LNRHRDFQHRRLIVPHGISHDSSHHQLEFVALPLCPPALDCCRCRKDAGAPVPCPAATLRPGYVQMVPSAPVRRNSREVPISPLLLSHPPVTGFLVPFARPGHVPIRHPPRVSASRLPCPSGNVARQQTVAESPWFTIFSEIIGLNVKHVNWKMTNNLAARTTVLSDKHPVIHSSS
jgi:hypothetical protein